MQMRTPGSQHAAHAHRPTILARTPSHGTYFHILYEGKTGLYEGLEGTPFVLMGVENILSEPPVSQGACFCFCLASKDLTPIPGSGYKFFDARFTLSLFERDRISVVELNAKNVITAYRMLKATENMPNGINPDEDDPAVFAELFALREALLLKERPPDAANTFMAPSRDLALFAIPEDSFGCLLPERGPIQIAFMHPEATLGELEKILAHPQEHDILSSLRMRQLPANLADFSIAQEPLAHRSLRLRKNPNPETQTYPESMHSSSTRFAAVRATNEFPRTSGLIEGPYSTFEEKVEGEDCLYHLQPVQPTESLSGQREGMVKVAVHPVLPSGEILLDGKHLENLKQVVDVRAFLSQNMVTDFPTLSSYSSLGDERDRRVGSTEDTIIVFGQGFRKQVERAAAQISKEKGVQVRAVILGRLQPYSELLNEPASPMDMRDDLSRSEFSLTVSFLA